jgi:Transposase zinc-binding domain
VVKKLHHNNANTLTRCALMIAAPSQDWNVFQQIFVEHWDGFKRVYPRYQTPYYDDLVDKMLRCGHPDQMGSIAYRCLHCGQGTHRVAMSCKSSLCLRCAKVYVDNGVSQVSRMLHEGVIYRHIVLTVPAILRQTFYRQSHAVLSPFMTLVIGLRNTGSRRARYGAVFLGQRSLPHGPRLLALLYKAWMPQALRRSAVILPSTTNDGMRRGIPPPAAWARITSSPF